MELDKSTSKGHSTNRTQIKRETSKIMFDTSGSESYMKLTPHFSEETSPKSRPQVRSMVLPVTFTDSEEEPSSPIQKARYLSPRQNIAQSLSEMNEVSFDHPTHKVGPIRSSGPSSRFQRRYSTSASLRQRRLKARSHSMHGFINDLPKLKARDFILSLGVTEEAKQQTPSPKNDTAKMSTEREQFHKTLSAKDLRIKELEEKLAVQKFTALNESQRMNLKIEQLIHSEKIKTAKLDSVHKEKSGLEIALANSEEANKALEIKETEQRKTVQKLELKFKGLEERLRLLKKENKQEATVSKSFVDTLQVELEALESKLKTQAAKLHNEKESSNKLRCELEKKSTTLEQIANQNSKLKSTVTNLESRLKAKEINDNEFDQLKETNNRLRLEMSELQVEEESLKDQMKTEIQLKQNLEARIIQIENSHVESNKTKIANAVKDQKMKIERLVNEVTRLKKELEMALEKEQELQSQLHRSQKTSMQCQLEKDEAIMALKRQQSAKLHSVENDHRAEMKQKMRKLHQLESEKTILEAKYSALNKQLSIIENSNTKTLNIQNNTIKSLEESLAQTRGKLLEAKEKLQLQTEAAEVSKDEHRRFQERLKEQDRELSVQKNWLVKKTALEDRINGLEKQLKDQQSKNTNLELDKEKFQMRMKSSEERLHLMQEQRARSLRIQQQTIEQLEKQTENTRKLNQQFAEKLKETEKKVQGAHMENAKKAKGESSESPESKVKWKGKVENEISSPKDTENPEGDRASHSKTYQDRSSREHKLIAKLTEQVKNLKKRNKDAGKAVKKLFRRNEALEAKLKKINRVRGQVSKALQWILQSLERELSQLKTQLNGYEKGSDSWIQTNSSIMNLEKMCEIWRKNKRDLRMEWSPQKPSFSPAKPAVQNQKLSRGIDKLGYSSGGIGEREPGSEMEQSSGFSPDIEVKSLIQELDVAKELTIIQEALGEIWLQPENGGSQNQIFNKITRLQVDLEKISARIGAAREEAAKTLKKYNEIKFDVSQKIKRLKQSSTSLQFNLNTSLDGALDDLKARLEEKPSKLSPSKRANLQEEYDGLKQKKMQLEVRSKELQKLESQLSSTSKAILELTSASEQALKKRLLISSLISDSSSLMKPRVKIPKIKVEQKLRDNASPSTRPIPSCPHCESRNKVDFNECKDSEFLVNCWNCKKVFFVEQNYTSTFLNYPDPSPRAMSPLSQHGPLNPWQLSSPKHNTKSDQSFQLLSDRSTMSKMYNKVCIKGLVAAVRSDLQLLASFYSTVFVGFEVEAQIFTQGDVEVSLDSPVTMNQINEMKMMIKLLHTGKHKVSQFVGQLEDVTIDGVRDLSGAELYTTCHSPV